VFEQLPCTHEDLGWIHSSEKTKLPCFSFMVSAVCVMCIYKKNSA
jgi:hypothetical protein